MANPYYTPATVDGQVLHDTEFTSIQTGFDGVTTALAGKAGVIAVPTPGNLVKQTAGGGIEDAGIADTDVVTLTGTQTLTGKTISAASNTISGITASRALVSDGSGNLSVSSVTATELGYLSGVTSAIQTQINAKASSGGWPASKAIVTDGAGALAASTATATEVSYLSGVTSAIQTQLNAKADSSGWTASRAMTSNGSGALAVSSVTDTELGYLSGVTSAVQAQLDARLALAGGTMAGAIAMGNNALSGAKTVALSGEVDNGTKSAGWTLDWNAGQHQKVTLAADCAVSFTAPSGPGTFQLRIIEDATGGWSLTLPTGKTPGGGLGTMTKTANSEALLVVKYDGTNYSYTLIDDFQSETTPSL